MFNRRTFLKSTVGMGLAFRGPAFATPVVREEDIWGFNVMTRFDYYNQDGDSPIFRTGCIGIGSQMPVVAEGISGNFLSPYEIAPPFPPYGNQFRAWNDPDVKDMLSRSLDKKKFSDMPPLDSHEYPGNSKFPGMNFIVFGNDLGAGPQRASLMAKFLKDDNPHGLVVGMPDIPYDPRERRFLGFSCQETRKLRDCFDGLIVLRNRTAKNFDATPLEKISEKARSFYYLVI